jgi:hypothetical protein
MQSLQSGLKMWGVPDNRVFYESFNPIASSSFEQLQNSATDTSITQAEVVFAQSNSKLTWAANDDTLLELAEANGIYPPPTVLDRIPRNHEFVSMKLVAEISDISSPLYRYKFGLNYVNLLLLVDAVPYEEFRL